VERSGSAAQNQGEQDAAISVASPRSGDELAVLPPGTQAYTTSEEEGGTAQGHAEEV
jgi:hypothetical protein